MSVYTATATAATSARKSPYKCTPPAEESAYAMIRLPANVIKIARIAFLDNFPVKNKQNPNATQMTSVHTMDVELATDVCCKDSNHSTKWIARNNPLKALRPNSFLFT